MMLSAPALLLFGAFQLLFLILLSVPVWHARGSGAVANRMVWGVLMSLAGMALLAQRGVLPNVLTMVLANALALAGNRVTYRQIYALYGLPRTARWERALATLGMVAYVTLWLADSSPGQLALAPGRVLAVSIPLCVSALYLLVRLHTRVPRPRSLGTRYLVVYSIMAATIHGLRALVYIASRSVIDPLHTRSAFVAVLGVQLASLLMAVGLILELEARAQAQLTDANERLHRDVLTDPLTGLGNRRHFELAATTELARARRHGWPVSVMLIDVDHFKRVNDHWGHPVGDVVLCKIARRCMHGLRAHDVLARWGGEEFALLLPHCDAETSEGVARRLLASVRETAIDEIKGQPVTVSIGVAIIEPGDATIGAALQRADAALYGAKRGGRDRHIVADTRTPGATQV